MGLQPCREGGLLRSIYFRWVGVGALDFLGASTNTDCSVRTSADSQHVVVTRLRPIVKLKFTDNSLQVGFLDVE